MNEWINKLASKSINQSIINKYGQFSWAQKKLLCNQCRHISWSFFMFVWRKFISLRKSTHAFCSQLFFSYLRFPQNLCVCCEQGSNIFESFPESLAGQALQSVASELIRVLGEKWRHNDSAAVNQMSITIKCHLTGMRSSMHFIKGYSMVTKLPLLSIYLHMDWDKKKKKNSQWWSRSNHHATVEKPCTCCLRGNSNEASHYEALEWKKKQPLRHPTARFTKYPKGDIERI